MGVSGLWQKLAYTYKVPLAEFFASLKKTNDGTPPRVGVDVRVGYIRHLRHWSPSLFQSSSPAGEQVLNLYSDLRDAGCHLVFVDDNNEGLLATPAKLDSFRRRAEALERKVNALDAAAALQRDGAKLSPETFNDRRKEVAKLRRDTYEVSEELVESFRSVVADLADCDYFEAPHQADGQLVSMFNDGLIDAVLSPDGDLLVHGLPFLVRNVTRDAAIIGSLYPLRYKWIGKPVNQPSPNCQLFMPNDLPLFRYTCACILGSDFLPRGVRNVGPAKLAAKVKDTPEVRENPARLVEWATQLQFGPGWVGKPNPLSLAVEAMMFEPVSQPDGLGIGYLHNTPKELHCLNSHCQVETRTTLVGQSSDLYECSRGHRLLPESFRFVQCDHCTEWLCEFCANLSFGDKPEEWADWQCVWCRLGATPDDSDGVVEGDEPVPLPPKRVFSDQLEDLAVRAPDEFVRRQLLRPESVPQAARSDLIQHLRVLQVPSSADATADQLRQLVRATLTYKVAVFPRLDPAAERQFGEMAGAWWAQHWPKPDNPSSAVSFFTDLSDKTSIMFLIRLLSALHTRASARPTNVQSLLGKYIERSAACARPCGGAERLVSRGVRGLVSERQKPFALHSVEVVTRDDQCLLYVRASVQPSMRSDRYDTELWLSDDKLECARCSCYAGCLMCTHAFVVLVQLETEAVCVGGWLVPCVNDAVERLFSTPEIAEMWPDLVNLARLDFGHLPDKVLMEKYRPGTEKRKPSPSTVFKEELEHLPAAKITWISPLRAAKVLRGDEFQPEPPKSFNPLKGTSLDGTTIDYIKVFRAFCKAPKESRTPGTVLQDTVGFHVVLLRALAEHRALPRRSTRLGKHDRPAEEDDIDDKGAVSSPNPRQRKRATRKCAFPKCGCTQGSDSQSNCERKWSTCPARSTSKKEDAAKRQNEKRAEYLRKIGRTELSLGEERPRVCGCHFDGQSRKVEDLSTVGVKAAAGPQTPSGGLAADRYRERMMSEHPSHELSDQLLARIAELEAKNAEMHSTIEALEDKVARVEAARLTEPRPPLRFSQLEGPRGAQEIYQRTQFSSSEHLVAYVSLLCNGDISVLHELHHGTPLKDSRGRNKILQPLDEALMYFEVERRGTSFDRLAGDFGVSRATVACVVWKWAIFVDLCRQAFGEYLSWEEYQKLVSPIWQARYDGKWCVLWDTTDVQLLGKPSHPDLQKLTHSEYYGGNVLKGGVGMFPFGWIIPAPLWTGGIADSKYMEEAKIFRKQMELAERDSGPPITNMTDKGMRCSEVAMEHAGQEFLTPAFKRRGEAQALPSNAFRTTAIAADRARNERMVLLPCRFSHFRGGFPLGYSPQLVDLLWKNICFRCNFLYKPPQAGSLEEWASLRSQAKELL